MIFKYNITIPLTYNRLAIQSNNPDSELRYEITEFCEEEFKVVFRTYEVPGHVYGYDFEDDVKIKIHANISDKRGSGTLQEKDNCRVICEIKGMLVDDEIYAKKFSEEIVDKICKRISLIFIKHNANRHLYQLRVEPVWSEAVFSRCEYAPFVEAKRKAFEKVDGNNKTLYLQDCMYIRDSIHSIAQISIPSEEIRIGEWLSKTDDIVEFLMNEYYSALGTENIKSKFFHLFSIIEFCEKEYEGHNGSSRLLMDDEVDIIIEGLQKQIDTNKRLKIVSILKNNLVKVSDIGRVEKLENILKWMGIETYRRFGSDKPIDKKLLSELTTLRNKSFHGTKENAADTEKKYADAVEVLLYICEKILDFLMKGSHHGKVNGVVLIYGKK